MFLTFTPDFVLPSGRPIADRDVAALSRRFCSSDLTQSERWVLIAPAIEDTLYFAQARQRHLVHHRKITPQRAAQLDQSDREKLKQEILRRCSVRLGH